MKPFTAWAIVQRDRVRRVALPSMQFWHYDIYPRRYEADLLADEHWVRVEVRPINPKALRKAAKRVARP